MVSPTGLYEYDALYRLIKAQGRELTNLGMATESDFVNTLSVPNAGSNAMQNYTQMFSYDELGNLQTMQSQGRWSRSYIYDNVTNRLLRHEGTNNVYTYDAHGNMTSMPHLSSMTWNSSDMLRSAGNGTFTSYYSYNAAGDRVRKVVEKGNIREERLYLGNYERYRKYVNNILKTERQTLHIIDDRHRFALIDRLTIDNGITLSTATNSIRYQYDNHLGSASLELDQTAAIISYEEYHPFGTTSYRSGRTETEVSQKRYKYVGKERDEETGLYYYGARYYAAWLCRFVSVDPLQFKYPHYTPYQYAGNKPVSYIDLDGLEENKTIELNWKISEQIDTRPELRVPMDEIWGIERFGGLDLGIVSEKGIESKDGKYTIHGIESGPNKGNWLVREHYENGDYKNLVVAGPEAFKEVRSGKFSERGTALNLIAAGEMLGADPTSTYRENILNGWKEAWTPENIVFSLLLAIAVIEAPLSGMVRKVGVNAAKTGWKVGEPITNLTAKVNVPAWSTVRQRFWKNEAFLNGSAYSESNLLRMQKGLAPQRLNPNTGLMESMELHHHIVPQRNGGLFDFIKVWPDEHRALDPFRM